MPRLVIMMKSWDSLMILITNDKRIVILSLSEVISEKDKISRMRMDLKTRWRTERVSFIPYVKYKKMQGDVEMTEVPSEKKLIEQWTLAFDLNFLKIESVLIHIENRILRLSQKPWYNLLPFLQWNNKW